MDQELLSVLNYVEHEKGIEHEVLIDAVKSALLSAARKDLNLDDKERLSIELDEKTGKISIFLDGKSVSSPRFGRIAAQTAKQVIIQKIKEAERTAIYDEYKDKVGTVLSGSIHRLEKGYIIVDLGKTEGIIPRSEQVKKETCRVSERLRAYLLETEETSRGPRIILSRKRKEFVAKLFEWEIPEIYEGIVEIKSIARDPGERTKIAVYSKDENVDSVGACVGVRGARVKNIVSELKGEKIDIVRWSSDEAVYITNALSPAELEKVELNKKKHNALVIVDKEQLSLAIGKKGQNVRLASELTGWEIDLRSREELATEKKIGLDEISGVGVKTAKNLEKAGFKTIQDLLGVKADELAKVEGVGKKTAEKIIKGLNSIISKM